MDIHKRLSTSGIYRLALYSRYISSLDKSRSEYVSSQELADTTGHSAAQVRKDLTHYGSLGEPGKGYEIRKLESLLMGVFGKKNCRNVVLIGVGNLGTALISHKGFQLQKFKIVAAFDRDIRKVGRHVADVPIYGIEELGPIVADTGADIAIVCVPAQSAQQIVDVLASVGIRAILNFVPASTLNIPEGVVVQNVDMSIELDRLYYLLKEQGNSCTAIS
jgi:redox-sensing transcriptional repressor